MKIWKNDNREMWIGETLIRIEIDHTQLPFLTLVPFYIYCIVFFWVVTPPAFVFFRRLFFIIPFFLLWPPCLKICLSPPRSLTESTLSHLTIIPALQDSLRRPSIDQQNIKQRFQIILRLLAKEYTHIICVSIMLCLLCPTWWHSWWT